MQKVLAEREAGQNNSSLKCCSVALGKDLYFVQKLCAQNRILAAALGATFGFRLANGAFVLWGTSELLIDLCSLNLIWESEVSLYRGTLGARQFSGFLVRFLMKIGYFTRLHRTGTNHKATVKPFLNAFPTLRAAAL